MFPRQRRNAIAIRAGASLCGTCAGAGEGRCSDRQRNATGNRFQEGHGPLPRRISPAVKRADKCAGHLRQHRPLRPRAPPRLRCTPPLPAFQTTLSLETSRAISAHSICSRTFFSCLSEDSSSCSICCLNYEI